MPCSSPAASSVDLKTGGTQLRFSSSPTAITSKLYQTKTDYGPAEFRRMVYQSKPRTTLDDFFGAFDCPDAGQPAPKRTSSTTPLEAPESPQQPLRHAASRRPWRTEPSKSPAPTSPSKFAALSN